MSTMSRTTFGPGAGQKRGYCGHQEIELALIRLYHLTGERKHLDLASLFHRRARQRSRTISTRRRSTRGEDPKDFWAKSYEYNQSHKPVREQSKVVGHAVRAMYMYSAMADLAAELKDDSLKRACEVLWDDVMASKIYITSGLGPAAANEGFTEDYDLPNDTAYAETCASVALIFWAQRMLHLDLDGKYADVMEQALFNGALTGPVARRRALFLLQSARQRRPPQPLGLAYLPVLHDERRRGWSPRSAAISSRTATMPSPSISMAASRPSVALKSGKVGLREISTYPWSGDIRIEVEPEQPPTFALKLRIPGWAHERDGLPSTAPRSRSRPRPTTAISPSRGNGQPGDVVTLDLPMPAERIYAHPAVRMDVGRVALKRGPLVYCVEEVDNPGKGRCSASSCRAAPRSRSTPRDDLFDGIVTLTADAVRVDDGDWGDRLYRAEPPAEEPATLTALPYYLWNNRQKGSMMVWLVEA